MGQKAQKAHVATLQAGEFGPRIELNLAIINCY